MEVMFHFDTVEFPDGNRGSGTLLRIQHGMGTWIFILTANVFRYTNEQEAWAKKLLTQFSKIKIQFYK